MVWNICNLQSSAHQRKWRMWQWTWYQLICIVPGEYVPGCTLHSVLHAITGSWGTSSVKIHQASKASTSIWISPSKTRQCSSNRALCYPMDIWYCLKTFWHFIVWPGEVISRRSGKRESKNLKKKIDSIPMKGKKKESFRKLQSYWKGSLKVWRKKNGYCTNKKWAEHSCRHEAPWLEWRTEQKLHPEGMWEVTRPSLKTNSHKLQVQYQGMVREQFLQDMGQSK